MLSSLAEIKKHIIVSLIAHGIEPEESSRECELIVEHATGLGLSEQVLQADKVIQQSQQDIINETIEQRKKRIPLQYCLGYTYFAGLKLLIRPGVLIPRSDTEAVVETALKHLDKESNLTLVDIGCGSGAIAITLLTQMPKAHVIAIDNSEQAIAICQENASLHRVLHRMTLICSDWQQALPFEVDAILANPPYIPLVQKPDLQPELSYEPPEALFGQGEDGLGFYRLLAKKGKAHLNKDGFVILEFGDGQWQKVSAIFSQESWQNIQIYNDLNNLPRVITARPTFANFKKLLK